MVADGGGAGAGIGGNGGKGGDSSGIINGVIQTGVPSYSENEDDYYNLSGHDGEAGESCGIINISGNVEVVAIGGSRRSRWKFYK